MRRIVVVGGGLAGLRAAQEFRAAGFDGELTVVGDEPHMPYNRPPLSKQVLAGTMEPEDCAFPLDDLDARWVLNDPAAGLDAGGRIVRTAGGAELPYDGLVVATGRRAREWPGPPGPAGVHVLRGLDDAIALRRAVESDPRVVVIGAGFVGCEVTATLRDRGVTDIHLVDVARLPMPTLGPEIGARAVRLHEAHGVSLHLGATVTGVEGTDRVEAVRLADGQRLPADVVLVALGSVPNTEWLAGSGTALHRGSVLCDARCFAAGRTDVVAAGDVASWPHPRWDDGPLCVEHWTNASEMARHAARSLLDPEGATPYSPVPTFWSDQYGASIKAVGLWGRSDDVRVLEEDGETGGLVAEGYSGGNLLGALVINRNRSFVDYRRRLVARYSSPHPSGPRRR